VGAAGGDAGDRLTKDERRIVSWSADRTVRLWDAATGQQIGPAMKHERPVPGALLTKDERRILSWSEDGTLRLWDAATGQQIGLTMEHEFSPTAAATHERRSTARDCGRERAFGGAEKDTNQHCDGALSQEAEARLGGCSPGQTSPFEIDVAGAAEQQPCRRAQGTSMLSNCNHAGAQDWRPRRASVVTVASRGCSER
jgi:hypothetical protein